MSRSAVVVVFLCCLLLQTACTRESSTQVSGEPRVIAFSPGIALTMADLGHEPIIVGRHDYDAWTGQNAPAVGHQERIDYEALLRARPTHILIEWGRRDPPPRLLELADDRGWTLRDLSMLSLDDIGRTADAIAELFGVGNDSWLRREDASPSAVFAERLRPVKNAFDGGVLLIGSVEPIGAVGPGSFHHDILERLGGRPVLTEGAAWQELDAEAVLTLSPGAIVIIAPGSSLAGAGAAREALGRVGNLPIPAIEAGRVAVIDDPHALLPSTSLVGFADALAELLERWGRGETEPSPAGDTP